MTSPENPEHDNPELKPHTTRDQFAELLIQAARKAGESSRMEYVSQDFQILFFGDGDGIDGSSSLHNVYAEYLEVEPHKREMVIRRFLRTILARARPLPNEFADCREDIMPVVRSRFFSERLRLETLKNGDAISQSELLAIPLGDMFEVVLVYDLPESMRFLNQETLREWGVSLFEVYEAAKENLEQRPAGFTGIEGKFYVSVEDDNYASSRILLTDRIRELDIAGDFVAMVPNRDSLFIAGTEDADSLLMLAEMGEQASKRPRHQGSGVIRLVGGEWESWLPSRNHPHFNRYMKLHSETLAEEYSDQKPLIAEILRNRADDTYVSDFMPVSLKNGLYSTFSVWSDGVKSLLPQSQRVVFMRGGLDGKTEPTILGAASWEHVREIVGYRMQETDYYPPRYLVEDFPDSEELTNITLADK